MKSYFTLEPTFINLRETNLFKDVKSLSILCIFVSIIIGALGQVWIKKGINNLGQLDFSSALINTYLKVFLSPYVLLGIFVYYIGVFFWLYALSKVDLSFAFPFVSLSYVLVFFLSWWFLGEHISILRWIGIMTICFGVLIVGKS